MSLNQIKQGFTQSTSAQTMSRFDTIPTAKTAWLSSFVYQLIISEINTKNKNRFCYSGFITPNSNVILINKGSTYRKTPSKRAVINNIYMSSKETKKRTNRKSKVALEVFNFDGIQLPINAKKSGCYSEVLRSIAKQLMACYQMWGRVFILRFDLRQHAFQETSKEVSRFIAALRAYVKRKYKCQLGFVWAREQEKAKGQHYHVVVFLDGDKVRHPKIIAEKINSLWSDNTCGSRHVWWPKKKHYQNVTNEGGLKTAFYWISYLAKTRGKGYRPPQSKDFNTSRLKTV